MAYIYSKNITILDFYAAFARFIFRITAVLFLKVKCFFLFYLR